VTDGRPAYRVDRVDGVLTLSFDQPDAGNAIPQEAVAGLTQLFRSIDEDRSVRAMLVRGEGRNFSSGGDVRSFALSLEQSVEERRADFGRRLDAVSPMVEAYLAIPVPIVAACQGAVAGAGLMYPLGADYVLADDSVAFMFSHQRVGLTPDGGVSLLLPRVVGARRAAELVLTAARIGAAEAHRIGMVSKVVSAGTLQDEAQKQALRFAHAPVEVVRAAKRLIVDSATRSPAEQLRAERDAIVASVGDPDFEEGVRAFVGKRAAAFPSAR
jgi:2-(1,2-epoxy-1,2-dihydrophenyl)acetyl-CoA isomerase